MRPILALAIAGLAAAAPLHAQRLIEHTPNQPNSVVPLPGMLDATLVHRFSGDPAVRGVISVATFDVAFGLPLRWPLQFAPGVRFSPAVIWGDGDEWEPYGRIGVLQQAAGAPLDVTATAAYNTRIESVDGELAVARRIGGLRVIALARAFTAPYGEDEAAFAVGGGIAWQPAPRHSPVTIAADVVTLADRREGEQVAWSAGVRTGLPHTALSVGVHATNTFTSTLQGGSLGSGRTRWGLELNAPVEFIGHALGIYASRSEAQQGVEGGVDVAAAHTVRISGYMYAPSSLLVRVGDVVEWVNDDAMVHTVTSETGAFDSRGMQPAGRWSARFTQRGVYPYYCGPHAFMKGVVIVR